MKIPVNPKLPKNFDCTPNEDRPMSHRRWWNRPYIQTYTLENFPGIETEDFKSRWLESWPTGTRYDLRCLDGGAWDRSTWYGFFKTLDEAMEAGKILAGHRKRNGNAGGNL